MGDLSERLAATGAELRALADQVRRLIDATVAAEAPGEALAAAARSVDAAVAALAPFVPAVRQRRYPMGVQVASVADVMPFDPIMGPLSPLSPPIVFAMEDGKAVGRVCFGSPYEGPPGCVHGGVLALAFDQVLNIANMMGGVAGPTKRLSLTFRKPTPLGADVVFTGWIEQHDAREVHSRGQLVFDGTVTVEAEGVFALLSPDRIMRLLDPDGGAGRSS